MPLVITVRAGDTKKIPLKNVGVESEDNLDEVVSAELYLSKEGEDGNHVDGVGLEIVNRKNGKLSFDPEGAKSGGGNALDRVGTYKGHIKLTWTDGETTRHPNNRDLYVEVEETLD